MPEKVQTNINDLPVEMLKQIFSFFKNPHDVKSAIVQVASQ